MAKATKAADDIEALARGMSPRARTLIERGLLWEEAQKKKAALARKKKRAKRPAVTR